jgi:glucose/arabinose dehydrogenase
MNRRFLRWAAPSAALLTSVIALATPAVPVTAESALPPGFVRNTYLRGFVEPVDMAFAPHGGIFVTEQSGRVRLVHKDKTLTTFLDIRAKVEHTDERGLVGIALDPAFATNHYVYLNYTMQATTSEPVHNRVVRVTARNGRAVPGSETVLLELGAQTDSHHVGGSLAFGPAGRLYVSTGDNYAPNRSQSLANLHGKVLRINSDGTIPVTNPFFDEATGRNRATWTLGLRNPFKIAFRPGSATMFVSDVGHNLWEEINAGVQGANYGWPIYEGPESDPLYRPPVFAYGHGETATTGCAITGGTFYDPEHRQFPTGYVGDFFYADLCSGWIRRYDPVADVSAPFAPDSNNQSPVDLEVGSGGSLYVLSRAGIDRIRYVG